MFKNYIITALRTIVRDKGYSFINIFGFAVGIACTVLILLWVQDELSYDESHDNKDRIYRVLVTVESGAETMDVGVTPAALAPALEDEYPEIEIATPFRRTGEYTFIIDDKKIRERLCGLAFPEFFSIFTVPFIEGNPETCLEGPNSLVLTKKLAKKYFGDKSAIGEEIELLGLGLFKVTAVVENITHSHFKFNYLISFDWARQIYNDNIDEFGSWNYNTYILANENTSKAELDEKLAGFFENHVDDQSESNEGQSRLFVQSLGDIYLKSDFSYDFVEHGNIKNVYAFSFIALIVLLIASINFMNLTTAKSANRAREIGVRKVQGAHKKHLVAQFYFESAIITFLSFIVALLIVELIMPTFNNLSGKELSQNILRDPNIILAYLVLAIITALISGSYPALYLSSFKPIKVLKGKLGNGSKSGNFRRVLVITQFTISIALILSTIVVNKQLSYINNKDIGYNKENLLGLWQRGNIKTKYDLFKKRLLESPNITNVSAISNPLSYSGPSTVITQWEGNNDENRIRMHFHSVDYDIIETLEVEMKNGRSFTHDFNDDSSTVFLINEAAVKKLGFDNAVGKSMTIGNTTGRIVGVFKDFNYNTIHHKINPLTLILDKDATRGIYVRIRPGKTKETMAYVRNLWKETEPNHPFSYLFTDQLLTSLYKQEQQVATLFKYFAILAILISCLGLFGLASFMTEQRQKEIGIRKVMGSKIGQLVMLLTKEFTKWVIFAGFIGLPIGYYLMNKWLQGFHYRIHPGIIVFVAALGIALFIAVATVSIQTYRASARNPVDTLRDE